VVAIAVAVLVLAAGWIYRDNIREFGAEWLRPGPAPGEGRPGVRALASANDKVATLRRAEADSVVLSASEMASLIGDGLDPSFRGNLDSLQVELLESRIMVRARLRTSAIPRQSLGPLAMLVQDWEPFSATGPVRVTAPTIAEWRIDALSLRDFPFPAEMIQWLVESALGGNAERGFPVQIPLGIEDVTVRPNGVTLYGTRQ
jgi:hypothetical protein